MRHLGDITKINWFEVEPVDCVTGGSPCQDLYIAGKRAGLAGAHGRWDDSGRYTFPGGGTAVRCTECGCALTVSEYHLNNWNYCPVCGAKMDGDKDA